jgi:hypothetical protein
MKGKVLGFDPASGTGAINGDDGKRYKFTTADNKSPQPLKPNDSLPTGGAAPAAGGAPAAGSDVVQQLLAKPNVIWAAVVILGSLIAGYVSTIELIGGGPMGMFGAAGFFYALLFFIPFVAGGLIFVELTNHQLTPIVRLAAGGFAAAGPIVLPLIGNSMLPGMMGMAVQMGGGGFSNILSVGSIITIAGGVLILLTHFGIIKKLG